MAATSRVRQPRRGTTQRATATASADADGYDRSMCLIALAWQAHPRLQLALIANRDELHDRPATAAAPDPDAPEVYGGRDLAAGGGWLQVSARRRLAAVTNVRAGGAPPPAPRSRGWLVRDFVRGHADAVRGAHDASTGAEAYGRFNLLLWDGACLAFATNHPRGHHALVRSGLHAMSNGAFDAPWPKSGRATAALAAWLEALDTRGDPLADGSRLEALFTALADDTPAPDETLPATGVGRELERALSPPFVRGKRYGTRCSSIVLVSDDAILFAERRFDRHGMPIGDSVRRLGPISA